MRRLPAAVATVVEELRTSADSPLYAVGGAVRDFLLDRPVLDLDLAVEGDAIALGILVGRRLGLQALAHRRFGTLRLRGPGITIDLAMTRSEHYPNPARLPQVHFAPLGEDLARRDFTVNAMAIPLSPPGPLQDPFGGRDDLNRRLIRVLQERSFVDDPTRGYRAIRYGSRLGFELEPETEAWLARDLIYVDLLTPARLQAELFAMVGEERPGDCLLAADGHGLLTRIEEGLRFSEQRVRTLNEARRQTPGPDWLPLAMAILAVPLGPGAIRRLVERLALPRRIARVVEAVPAARIAANAVAAPRVRPSEVVGAFEGRPAPALRALALTTPSPALRVNIESYLDRWRRLRPAMSGDEVQRLGLRGAELGAWLRRLRDARLDGEVTAKGERRWLLERLKAPATAE